MFYLLSFSVNFRTFSVHFLFIFCLSICTRNWIVNFYNYNSYNYETLIGCPNNKQKQLQFYLCKFSYWVVFCRLCLFCNYFSPRHFLTLLPSSSPHISKLLSMRGNFHKTRHFCQFIATFCNENWFNQLTKATVCNQDNFKGTWTISSEVVLVSILLSTLKMFLFAKVFPEATTRKNFE